MQTPLLAAVLAALVPAVAAQSPLWFRTSDESGAHWVLRAFSSRAELPELQAGQHWELSIDDGGQVAVRAQPGEVATFECTARPGDLMELFEEQLRSRRAMFQGAFAVGLAGVGVKTKEAVKLYRALLDFPHQIAEARMQIDGDFRRPERGFRTSLEVDAVAGTWFDRLVTSLMHHPEGPPTIDDDDSHLTVLWAAKMADAQVLAPFTEFFASLFGDSGGSREKRIQMVNEMWQTMEGTMAMTFDFELEGYVLLQGVSDAQRLQKLYDDDDFKSWIEGQYQAMFQLDPSIEEVKFVPDGFEYRGVKMHKTIQLAEEGESLGVDGVTAHWAISCMGVGEAEIKAIVDRVLDGQIKSNPLPEGVLAAIHMRHVSEWDLAGTGQKMDEAPARIDLTIGKSATGLVMRIAIE